MGSVWRAEHLALKSPVAVKLMDPASADDEEAPARFMREAQAAAALRSTHVVQILDYDVDQSTPFIVFELLHGENLAERLKRDRTFSAGAFCGPLGANVSDRCMYNNRLRRASACVG